MPVEEEIKSDPVISQFQEENKLDEMLEPVEILHQQIDTIIWIDEQEQILIHEEITVSVAKMNEERRKNQLETVKYEIHQAKDRNPMVYEKKLIEWLALDSNNEDFTNMLADHYFDNNDWKKALTLYKKILEIDPTRDVAMRKSAIIMLELWDIQTAEFLTDKVIEFKPENPRYLMTKAEILYQREQLEEVSQLLEKITKLRPSNTEYMFALAKIYREMGDEILLRKTLSRIVEIEPNNTQAKEEIRKLDTR